MFFLYRDIVNGEGSLSTLSAKDKAEAVQKVKEKFSYLPESEIAWRLVELPEDFTTIWEIE